MDISDRITRVIDIAVRQDGSLRIFEVYQPPGESKRQPTETTDVIEALVDIHDRVTEIRDVFSAPTT